MQRVHPYVSDLRPVVLAHQGSSKEAPSNTLPAFDLAIRQGADILETDIHWTKDGHIVLCHDDTVDRTSNGHGAIRDFTLAELKQLDFGYRFTPDDGQTFPYRGCGVRIPTLREALAAFPEKRLNLDIKPRRHIHLQTLLRDIYDMHASARVLVASFHHDVLRAFREMNRAVATSASVRETGFFCARTILHSSSSRPAPFVALQVPMATLGFPVVTRSFIDRAHRMGLKVQVWTIDDEAAMTDLLAMGVDGIVSNRPAVAVAVRDMAAVDESAS